MNETKKTNMNNQIVINGNNIEVLKSYPDNYFDAVVTDPPYGLGKEPNAAELMKDWVEHGYHEVKGTGFMGKEWDAFVPQPIFWKEVFRVLKHGGHVLSFFGTRTYDWGVMSMRFAGFEVRDCIQWLYGSGFPKSHNISKAIDKMQGAEREIVGEKLTGTMNNKGGASVNADGSWDSGQKTIYVTKAATEKAKQWEGWGTALKPANEPIVLARKPLEKGLSVAENILKWGVGGINIDGCRVKTNEKINSVEGGILRRNKINQEMGFRKYENGFENQDQEIWEQNPQGRFPANIILTHHPECLYKGTKKVKAIKGGSGEATMKSGMGKNGIYGAYSHEKLGHNAGGLGDADGNETIENWECHEDCPIKILDEQSGTLNKQGVSKSDNKSGWQNQYVGGNEVKAVERKLYLDTGGASRFFYVAKASKSERNKGLDGFEAKQMAWSNQAKAELKRGNTEFADETKMHNKVQERINFHPTVKPIKLMQYLVKMITPPNGIVLDPFCGSGTTGVACRLEGYNFVGMEQDPEYCKIAKSRIDNYVDKLIDNQEDIENENEPIISNNDKPQLELF